MANDKIINEIADKLNNHGSQVNPQMWQAISSQVGASSAVGVGSAIGAGKVAAIAVGIAAVSVASYFGLRSDEPTVESTPNTNQVAQTKVETVTKEEKTIESSKVVSEVKAPISNDDSSVSAPVQKQSGLTKNTSTLIDAEAIQIKVPGYIGVRTIDNSPKASTSTQETTKSTISKPVTTPPQVDATDNVGSKPVVEKPKNTTNISNPIKTNINVFTPNGDGINDYFEVVSEGLTDYSIVIMDAQNRKVWESNDPNAKWDGKDMSGQIVKRGRYLCLIAGNGKDGKPFGKHEILNIRY